MIHKNKYTSLIGDTIAEKLEVIIAIGAMLNASDVHIDCGEGFGVVYLRVASRPVCQTYTSIDEIQKVIGRIKVLSNMRLDITDRSQDGSFVHNLDETKIHIRSASSPTVFGESIVCRLFITTSRNLRFRLFELGIPESDLSILKRVLSYETGLILVSGPTGSGKTTTLYSCINHLLDGSRVIVTLEDPVEIIIPNVRQIKVQNEYGYGFAAALRGVLRQDPDIIMIGEIRDAETASLAIQAALTGHLVLATIHAPSALEIIDRLHALGVSSSSCASVITLLLSQRKIKTQESNQVVFELIEFSQKLKSTLLASGKANSLSDILRQDGILLLKDRLQNLYSDGYISKEEMNKYVR